MAEQAHILPIGDFDSHELSANIMFLLLQLKIRVERPNPHALKALISILEIIDKNVRPDIDTIAKKWMENYKSSSGTFSWKSSHQ